MNYFVILAAGKGNRFISKIKEGYEFEIVLTETGSNKIVYLN